MPLSIKSLVFGCQSLQKVAYRGRIVSFVAPDFVSELSAFCVFGPDTRITATPHFPDPVRKIFVFFSEVKFSTEHIKFEGKKWLYCSF